MKKWISVMIVLLMLLLTACSGVETLNTSTDSENNKSTISEVANKNGDDTMIKQTINFTEDGRVCMTTYLHQDTNGDKLPAIIVLPGGAYGFLAESEGEPVALTFFERGFQTFVLNYSVGDASVYPAPLDDVSKAIWEIRKNANEWNVDADAIALMGFSAGSGIASMSATQWNTPGLYERVGAPNAESIKPNAAVIGYGAANNSEMVIDNPDVYIPSMLGKIARDKTPQLDVVNYVGSHTCPMFIWHNRYDRLVPAVSPLVMAEALYEHDVPFEVHVFEEGQHGMSVGNNAPGGDLENSQYPNVDMWVPMCVNWLDNQFQK